MTIHAKISRKVFELDSKGIVPEILVAGYNVITELINVPVQVVKDGTALHSDMTITSGGNTLSVFKNIKDDDFCEVYGKDMAQW